MRNPGGYAQVFFPDGNKESTAVFDETRTTVNINAGVFELDSFSCSHCNAVVHVPAKSDVNFVGFCRHCMKPVCQRCSALPCHPFEKALQEAEERDRIRRSYGS
jgi:hypothetical protein